MIFLIVGRSGSGKDTVCSRVLNLTKSGLTNISLHPIIAYTTRPMRTGEKNGKQYHFVDENFLRQAENSGRLITLNSFNTFNGVWHYFNIDDKWYSDNKNYIAVTNLKSALDFKYYYGEERVRIIFLDVCEDALLQRAISREKKSLKPDFKELCRRFLADAEDYSAENIKKTDISIPNEDSSDTAINITRYIEKAIR